MADDRAPEAGLEANPKRRGSRPPLRGLSYGSSALIHTATLLALSLPLVLAPLSKKTERAVVRLEVRARRYDEALWRGLSRIPKPRAEKPEERPVEVRDEWVSDPQRYPRGGDLWFHTSLDLGAASYSDAFGVGGGPASKYGTAAGAEKAITAALRWLRRHQASNGRWSAAGWPSRCSRGGCSGPGRNRGADHLDAGVTGAALLAFIGHRRFEDNTAEIRSGLLWLIAQQAPDGSIGFDESGGALNHSLATLALCEAYAAYGAPNLGKAAQRAVDFCPRALKPSRAWRFGFGLGVEDRAAESWLLLALESARSGGLDLPREHCGFALLRSPYAPFHPAGPERTSWSEAVMRALAERNRQGGCEDGSWDPAGEGSVAGGRVYATAINALALEVYERKRLSKNRRSP